MYAVFTGGKLWQMIIIVYNWECFYYNCIQLRMFYMYMRYQCITISVNPSLFILEENDACENQTNKMNMIYLHHSSSLGCVEETIVTDCLYSHALWVLVLILCSWTVSNEKIEFRNTANDITNTMYVAVLSSIG